MFLSRPFRPFLLLACLSLGSLPLAADGEARFGVEGGLALPNGNLSTAADTGFEIGAIGRWEMGGGRGVTARIDLDFFAQKAGITTSSLGVAADYTFHLTGGDHGPYFLVGASVLDYSQNHNGATNSTNSLGLDLGVGVDIDTHLGLLARWTSHYLEHSTWTVLNLGVTYTF